MRRGSTVKCMIDLYIVEHECKEKNNMDHLIRQYEWDSKTSRWSAPFQWINSEKEF